MARLFVSGSSQSGTNLTAAIASGVYTYSVWAMKTATTANPERVVAQGTSAAGFQVINFGVANAAKWEASSDGAVTNAASNAAATLNTWVHLASTYALTPLTTLFVNGVQQTTTANGSANYTGVDRISIGSNPQKTVFFDGRLADWAIWNVILTAAEISALAAGARPNTIRPANLVRWWPIDGLQSPEPDLSSNAKSATLTNAPVLAPGPPVAPFTRRSPPILLPVEGISGARKLSAIGGSIIAPGGTPAWLVGYGGPLTAGYWTNIPATSTSLNAGQVFCDNGFSARGFYFIATGSNGTTKAGVTFPGVVVADSLTTLSLNTWHYLLFTHTSGTSGAWKIYVDGVQKNTGTSNRNNLNSGDLGQISGNLPFANLQDCALWNAVLTQSEVTALAQGALPNTVRGGNLKTWVPCYGLTSPEPSFDASGLSWAVTTATPAPGAPTAPFSPRWPQNLDIVAAPSFNPAWRVPFNQVVSGGVAT